MLVVMAARTRGNGAPAHPIWNLKNVDFSGVTRIFGLQVHKGVKAFSGGILAARTRGVMGHLHTPSEIKKMLISVA